MSENICSSQISQKTVHRPCIMLQESCNYTLIHRLCERQTPSGGLNGRPEKLQDVSQ